MTFLHWILCVLILAYFLQTDLFHALLIVISVKVSCWLASVAASAFVTENFVPFYEYSSPNGRYGNYGSYKGYPYYRGFDNEMENQDANTPRAWP